MDQSNRLLVRNINSGELAAVKIPPPELIISSIDITIPIDHINLNFGLYPNSAQLQIYDSDGNGVDAAISITSTTIGIVFQSAFVGFINVLYRPDHTPRITSIVPDITSDELYHGKLYALGGVPPYTFSIIEGSLPNGIVLNSATGEISGISTFPQTEQINIRCRVSDFYGNSSEATLTISLHGSEIYGRVTKDGSLRITKAGNIRITKAQ